MLCCVAAKMIQGQGSKWGTAGLMLSVWFWFWFLAKLIHPFHCGSTDWPKLSLALWARYFFFCFRSWHATSPSRIFVGVRYVVRAQGHSSSLYNSRLVSAAVPSARALTGSDREWFNLCLRVDCFSTFDLSTLNFMQTLSWPPRKLSAWGPACKQN